MKKIIPNNRLERVIFFGLLALLIGYIIFLVDARSPWDTRIVQRLEQGKNLRLQDYIIIGSWWAGWINLFLIFILLATSHFWLSQLTCTRTSETSAKEIHHGWIFRIALSGALFLCTFFCWQRMSLSLWGDEEYSVRQAILGNYKELPDGELVFFRYNWKESLWSYKNPNNHFLSTILARISNDIWMSFVQNSELPFSETALRLPSLFAGLLCLPAIAFLLARMGYPLAGILSAYWLAIHPWFIKYASEVRGYSLVFLFSILAVHCLVSALQREKLRWWIAFAFCNFCVLYAYPGSLFLVWMFGISALVGIFAAAHRSVFPQATRFLFSGILFCMLFIQLIAPTVPQMLYWLQRDRAKASQGVDWILDFWGNLTTGMSWHPWASGNPLVHAVQHLYASSPVLYWFVLLGIPAVAIFGFICILQAERLYATIAVAWLIAPVLGYLQASLSGNILYVWYLIYALPLLAILVGLGLSRPFNLITEKKISYPVTLILALVFGGLYFFATRSQRQTLCHYPVEPQRDSAQLTRTNLNPFAEENKHILTATVTFGTRLYDPLQVEIDSPESLQKLMDKSDAHQYPLFINFGSEAFSRAVKPEVMQIIESSGEFELIQRLYGLDIQNTRVVYRYRGRG